MNPLDIAWHLANFLAPAVVVALLTASASKLLWRDALRGVGWGRLVLAAGIGCTVTLIGGLLWFGRDGRIATYGAMIVACALCIWLVGFARQRR